MISIYQNYSKSSITYNTNELSTIAKTTEDIYRAFKMPLSVVNPKFTPYGFMLECQPKKGINISKYSSIKQELSFYLGGRKIDYLLPVPGKNCIGILVYNEKPCDVYFADIVNSLSIDEDNINLAVGTDSEGNNRILSLNSDRCNNILIAGTTGAGKSVLLHNIIMSIITTYSPERIRIAISATNPTEYIYYNGIPNLLIPIISDVKKTLSFIKWLYGVLIERENEAEECSNKPQWQSIVSIIDDYNDVALYMNIDVYEYLVALIKRGFRVGIHLILSAQKPSQSSFTTDILENCYVKIAFRLTTTKDSLYYIDSKLPTTLYDNGDMIVYDKSIDRIQRVKAAYIPDSDIRANCQNIIDTVGEILN